MPKDAEVQVENEQNFLSRQLNILNTQAPPPPIPPTRPVNIEIEFLFFW